MQSRLRRAVVGVAVLVSLLLGAGLLAAPAQAAPTPSPFTAGSVAIDCGSLQDGYYRSMRITATLTGLTPSTTYQLKIEQNGSSGDGPTVDVATDAAGSASSDAAVSGAFVSGALDLLALLKDGNRVSYKVLSANVCPSGVNASGALSAAIVCPDQYVTPRGVGTSQVRVQAVLSGFIPGGTYKVVAYATGVTQQANYYADLVAGTDGVVTIDGIVRPSDVVPPDSLTWTVSMTSQASALLSGTAPVANPCSVPVKSGKRAALTHDNDFTGDGYADLLVMNNFGQLVLYTNGIRSNPGGVPFTSGRIIGSGWDSGDGMLELATGDISGDGVSEIIGMRLDGSLVAYYNNIGSSPAKLPFSSPTVIGSGWAMYTRIALGDVDGDGYADIIADRPDGSRWFYKNRFATDPLHRPFSSGVRLPIDVVQGGPQLADFNGDGYADLWDGGSYMDLNRTPAGNSAPFPENTPFSLPASMQVLQSGGAAGDYEGRGSSGMIVGGENGQLLYLKDPLSAQSQPRVIGSGWDWHFMIIR